MRFALLISILILGFLGSSAQPDHSVFTKYSYEQIVDLIATSADPDTLAGALYHRSRKLFLVDNDRCLKSFEEALGRIQELGNDSIYHAANLFYVLPLVNSSQYARAHQRLELSKKHYTQSQDFFRLASVYVTEGYLQRELLNYQKAVQLYQKAMDIYEGHDFENVHYGINNVNNRIGIINSLLGNDRDAIKYFERVRSHCTKNQVNYFYRAATNNLAESLLEIGQKERAILLKKEVIQIREKSQSTTAKRAISNDRAFIAELNDDLSKAILHKDTAIYYSEILGNHSFIISDYFSQSKLYKRVDDYRNEQRKLHDAYELAIKHQNKRLLPQISKSLGDNYMLAKEAKTAAQYYQKYSTLQDSVNLSEELRNLQRIESISEISRYTEDLEQASAAAQLNRIRLRKVRQRNIFLGLFSLGILGLLLFVYRNNRRKQRQKEVLSKQKKAIESNLRDKEVLLREIHHRVKNNLQVVSSMLNLNARYVNDDSAKAILLESRNRVKSMALIHQKLYQEEDLKGVKLNDYLTSLSKHLIHSNRKSGKQIKTFLEVDEISLDVDVMIPLGLMVNEVFSNCMKHAFEGRNEGKIWITSSEENGNIILTIKDDGIGFQYDGESQSSGSFGMTLIYSLAEKLKAEIDIKENEGSEVSISFRNPDRT